MIYLLDGLPLSKEEATLHLGFLRSAKRLSPKTKAPESFDHLARESFDYADAMTRENRRRCRGGAA